MGNSYFVDHLNTDVHAQKMQAIIGEMEANAANIRKLPGELAPAFGGETADAHKDVTAKINSMLDQYTGQLTALKSMITVVAGSGGDFQVSDHQGASRFVL